MIDLINLKVLKEKNLISFKKVGDAYEVTKKQFNTNTGLEIEPIVESLDIDSINKIKLQSENLINNCNEILTDLKNLDEK